MKKADADTAATRANVTTLWPNKAAERTGRAANDAALTEVIESVVWIVVADGGCADFYHYHKDQSVMPAHEARERSAHEDRPRHGLTRFEDMSLKAESLTAFNVGHDSQGTFIGGSNSAHNSGGINLDVRDEVKQNLVVAIANKLHQAVREKRFAKLVLVAPQRIMVMLKNCLHADVLACVIAEVAKDYTHDQGNALLEHLRPVLADAHIG
jgi:protein required for attachment to host cells